MEKKCVLVIDDERNVAYSIRRALESKAWDVATATSGNEGISRFNSGMFDAVIVDIRLPDVSGLEVMRRISESNATVPVIVMTAYSAADTAIEAIKEGAFDYLVKPVDLEVLRGVVQRALSDSAESGHWPGIDKQVEEDAYTFAGQSAPMQEVYKLIGKYSREPYPVLILGESGTGKELAARSIHRHSQRNTGPFVAMNCAAIPESLLESELFGHEKGSFSGAEKLRIGKFEQAGSGTIFLDEIGDMSPKVQAKILRVIQERQFERVGGVVSIGTDARIVAATNMDLDQMVQDGKFRGDLMFRLNCLTLRMPALRDRTGDIQELAMRFLALYNRDNMGRKRALHSSTIALLEKHDWPGNVRELRNAINFSAINSRTSVILPESLPDSVGSMQGVCDTPGSLADSVVGLVASLVRDGNKDVFRRAISTVERLVIKEAMEHCKGNQVQASEFLGIARTTLRAKCVAYDLGDAQE